MTDLGDKLAALGFGKGKSPQAKPAKQASEKVADFRPASAQGPNVSDLEAAMMSKLAEEASHFVSPLPQGSKAKQSRARPMDNVSVEVRKRPTSRPINLPPAPSKIVAAPRNVGARLTAAARERLRYEPALPHEEDPTGGATLESQVVGESIEERFPAEVSGEPNEAAAAPRELNYREAFSHITALVGSSMPEIEPRATEMECAEKDMLDRRVSRGAAWLRDNPDPDEVDGYVVGFDFGTSSLKLVVREPYMAGNEVAAVPAPVKLRSREHPYLWQTVVWFDPAHSTFHLYPVAGAKVLEGFKTGIVGGNGKEAVWDDPEVSRSEAATAFIALHLCHLMGWYDEERPLKRSAAKNYLSINIGVPVATQDNPATLAPFEEVVRAAVELSRTCEPVTLRNVKDALEISRQEQVPHGFSLVPELSAALVGYATNPTNPNGAHVLIDVGASTLDIVAFNLVERDGQPEIKAFAASVELLGAAALDVIRLQGIDVAEFSKACNQQFGDTYGDAIKAAPSSFSKVHNPKRPDVRLVVTGGGCATDVHSALIEALPERQLGRQTPSKPEPPEEIAPIDCDRSRLLLAFGLAHDHPDIPHPTLPSRIPLVPVVQGAGPTYVGPEMT